MSLPFLTVEEDRLVIHPDRGSKEIPIKSREEFHEALEKFGGRFVCSSSVDFPKEYTKLTWIHEICEEFRNGVRERRKLDNQNHDIT